MFWTDSISLCYSNIAAAKTWWIRSFGCKEEEVPTEWDCTLPSDVALRLPGHDLPTILLSDLAEVVNAGYERSNNRPILFCSKLAKAQEQLNRAGVVAGPIQHGGGTEYFEVHDPEDNIIEVCREP